MQMQARSQTPRSIGICSDCRLLLLPAAASVFYLWPAGRHRQ
jgi:hypothetical protein